MPAGDELHKEPHHPSLGGSSLIEARRAHAVEEGKPADVEIGAGVVTVYFTRIVSSVS